MNAHNADNGDPLSPELLAAYADGELTPAECARVEAWLAAHPDARADVEEQRRLARLFDQAAPPPPSDERWSEAMAHVRDRLAVPPAAVKRWQRRAALAALLAVAAAAAVLALVLNSHRTARVDPASPPRPGDDEVFSVASPDDVEILSMDDRDRGALVVGEPPVNEPMEMVTVDDVKVNKLPDVQGRVARLHIGSGAPYVVMSVGQPDPNDDPEAP